jgi:CRP-like cAMP-binding protein
MKRAEELERAAEAYPLLAGLAPEHLANLLEIAEERHFDKDEIIFREGTKSEYLFLITSGTVGLEIAAGGKRILVQTLGSGDAMGWSALAEQAKTHFQARPLSRVRAIAFNCARLAIAFQGDPNLGYEIMKRLLELATERLDHTRMQAIDMYRNPGAAYR